MSPEAKPKKKVRNKTKNRLKNRRKEAEDTKEEATDRRITGIPPTTKEEETTDDSPTTPTENIRDDQIAWPTNDIVEEKKISEEEEVSIGENTTTNEKTTLREEAIEDTTTKTANIQAIPYTVKDKSATTTSTSTLQVTKNITQKVTRSELDMFDISSTTSPVTFTDDQVSMSFLLFSLFFFLFSFCLPFLYLILANVDHLYYEQIQNCAHFYGTKFTYLFIYLRRVWTLNPAARFVVFSQVLLIFSFYLFHILLSTSLPCHLLSLFSLLF